MSKLRLVCLKGLPGSGKSTYAQALMKAEFYRVNKDQIREMFKFGKWDRNSEKMVVEYEYATVRHLLSRGHPVVVDDTNFHDGHIKTYQDIAKAYAIEIEIIAMDTSVEECIARDARRKAEGGRGVGEQVIKNMAFKYGLLQRQNGEPYVVCDVDGTVFDISHRTHWVRGPRQDQRWDKFLSPDEMIKDAPRTDVINQLWAHKNEGRRIVMMSARNECHRKVTEEQFAMHKVPYDEFYLRKDGDFRADDIVKAEMIDNYLDQTKIIEWFDDRPKVIRMLRERGINVIDVGNGEEF